MASRPAPLPRWFWFASLLGCTPGFKKSRCKKLLRVTMSRIKLLRGRREVQVRQLRRDVAQLLQLGQEENAESRLDRLWKEQSLLSAYIKTGEFCQLVKSNLSNIAGQRECPMDLKESLASLCFAASCCADLPELQEIREIVVMKYGKDFLISSHKLLPGSHVNKMFLEAFSTNESSEVSKKALLKGILTEYNIVQPKKPKFPPIEEGSQASISPSLKVKAAPSDLPRTAVACDASRKQESRHEHGSNFDICKQRSNFDCPKQEVEKHHKSPKQTGPTACTPTFGTLDKQHTPFPCAEGNGEIKMQRRHKKVRKNIHGQVNKVEEVTNETELGSQDVLSRALSHDRHGKERKSKQKAYKRDANALQDGEEDQHPLSNGRFFHEKAGLVSAANEVIFGDGKMPLPDEPKIRSHFETLTKTSNEKFRLERETNGVASGQHWMHEHGEEYPTREFDCHAMQREKKIFYDERLAETKQKVPVEQPWKQRYREEAPPKGLNAYQIQEERNLDQEEHYHIERHVHGRSNGKSRSERVIQEFDKKQRELPHRDYGDMETESNWYHRSSGKSLPERVTNEFDNAQRKRSPHKRNHHHRYTEKSMLERDAHEFGNQQPSLIGDRSLPEHGDTHKVQKARKHSSMKSLPENANVEASRDHPSAHVSQKGKKKSMKKDGFNETQQEDWIDYHGSSMPDKTADVSPHLIKHADNNGDQLKDAGRQEDRNLHWMENQAKTETCGDHKEARLNGSAHEPYMEDEHLPEDYDIYAMQKNRRRPRKHNIDHADSRTKVLNGHSLDRRPRGEIIAEEVVNGQIHWSGYNHGSLIREDDSTHVTQSEKAYFPQWHQQLDSNPKVLKESGSRLTAAEVRNGSYGYGDMPQQKHFDQQEDAEEKIKSCETSPLPSRFTKPPQRPPPPVPPYRVSSLPNRQPLNNAPVLPQRCTTLETSHFRSIQEPHVHPKLPEYEDLVASFAALRNKPAKPPAY